MKYEKYKDEALNFLSKIISYPTVLDKYTPDSNIPFGVANKECLTYILDKADKDGFKTFNADNYAGHIEYGEGDEVLGILAHVDVVPVKEDEWKSSPFKLDIRDGKMFGRGVMDDKGPFVASYIAMRMLQDDGFKPSKKIRLIFGCDEESGSRCLERYLSLKGEPDIAFSPDAEFPVINGEKGMISYNINFVDNVVEYFDAGQRYNIVPSYAEAKLNVDVKDEFFKYLSENNYNGEYSNGMYKTYGVAAHAMCPEKGVNAAYILFDFISKYTNSRIASFVSKYYLFDTYGKLAGYYDFDPCMKDLTSNFAVVKIDGYKGLFGVNCRVPKDEDFELIEKSLDRITKEYGYNYEIISKSNRHYISEDSFLVKSLMESYVKITGDKVNKPFSIGGGTYARECKNAVAFGPLFPGREDVCHIANEYMYEEDFYKLIEIYYDVIYRLAK